MRRFFVPPTELKPNSVLSLTGDEFHHLKNVCRLEVGERIELLDGQGHIALAEIQEIKKKSAEVNIMKISEVPPLPSPRIKLVLCIPKFQTMDLVIQKSVELGVETLVPVVSDRSFMKTLNKDLKSKSQRWNKIATEGCKQSGRAWPMNIIEPTKLQAQIEFTKSGEGLFLYEGEGTQDIKTALSSKDNAREQVTVFVGAEGGFSSQEVQVFKEKNLEPVTLGPLVLRVETACIAVLSIIQYQFDLLR